MDTVETDNGRRKRATTAKPPPEKKTPKAKPLDTETNTSSSEDETTAKNKSVVFSKMQQTIENMSESSSDENYESAPNVAKPVGPTPAVIKPAVIKPAVKKPSVQKSTNLESNKSVDTGSPSPKIAVTNISTAITDVKKSCNALLKNATVGPKVQQYLTKFGEIVYSNCTQLLLHINEQQEKLHRLELALAQKPELPTFPTPAESKNARRTRNRDRSASRTKWATLVRSTNENGNTEKAFKEAIKENKPEEVGGPFLTIKTLKSGNMIVETETKAKQEKLNKVLARPGNEALQTKPLRTSNPSIILSGVDTFAEISEQNIGKVIAENNPRLAAEIGRTNMEKGIKFLTKRQCRNPAKWDWKIVVTPEVYKILIKEEKIAIDYTFVYIREHIDVTRCFKCNQYGHVSKYCKAAKETCPKCAEQYENKETHKCSPGKVCCTNCKIMGLNNQEHCAWDNKCPIYLRKLKQASQLVNYGNN